MVQSDRYLAGLSKLIHQHREDGLDVTVEALRNHVLYSIPGVPEGLVEEIYLRYLDRFNRSGRPDSAFLEDAVWLAGFVDLFFMEYDDAVNPLAPEDWAFLKEAVNGYDDELPLKLLTHIMQEVVEHGGFGG